MSQSVSLIMLYSALSILLFHITPEKYRRQVLFAENVVFYLLCDWRFFVLLLLETTLGYCGGGVLDRRKRKRTVVFFTVSILIVLAGFKYFNFFIERFRLPLREIVLPLGISYYSFRLLSYLFDVYGGKIRPESSFVCFANYVMFFPHLLCGPIARPGDMLPQLKQVIHYSPALFERGVMLILTGLFKKTVIADRLGMYVDKVFYAPASYPVPACWMAAFFYALQLYCDFSGYSDIAIGVTNMFGMIIPENFKRPYFANGMNEFWNRWHISLSGWLRDYVYIPLGGSRRGGMRTKRNLLVTFFLCGLWHGTGFNYIVWGIYHAAWRILMPEGKRIAGRIMTFLIAMFGWILFRANNLFQAKEFIMRLFFFREISAQDIVTSILPFTNDYAAPAHFMVVLVMTGILFSYELLCEKKGGGRQEIDGLDFRPADYVYSGIFLAGIILFGVTGTGGFLYSNY